MNVNILIMITYKKNKDKQQKCTDAFQFKIEKIKIIIVLCNDIINHLSMMLVCVLF